MFITTECARLRLQRGEISRLADAAHTRLTGVAGTLWVTIDHDQRDIVLEAGDAFDVQGDKPVLISAIGGPAVVEMSHA